MCDLPPFVLRAEMNEQNKRLQAHVAKLLQDTQFKVRSWSHPSTAPSAEMPSFAILTVGVSSHHEQVNLLIVVELSSVRCMRHANTRMSPDISPIGDCSDRLRIGYISVGLGQ